MDKDIKEIIERLKSNQPQVRPLEKSSVSFNDSWKKDSYSTDQKEIVTNEKEKPSNTDDDDISDAEAIFWVAVIIILIIVFHKFIIEVLGGIIIGLLNPWCLATGAVIFFLSKK